MEVYDIIDLEMPDGRKIRSAIVVVECDLEGESIDIEAYTLYYDFEPAIEITEYIGNDALYRLSINVLNQIKADIADDEYSKFISQH
jgi:hypothetical protein